MHDDRQDVSIPQPAFDFGRFLRRWGLVPDGPAFATRCSDLLPVLCEGAPAMLKVAHEDEERLGHVLMRYWDGDGAARVLAHADDAVVLERAMSRRSLVDLVRAGPSDDDEASRIICAVAGKLHRPRQRPLPKLLSLEDWFAALWPGAQRHGGNLVNAARVARDLLLTQRDVTTLHGDLHHENVLHGGAARGWLAIDPKRIHGDRGFDFANIVCNPDRDLGIVTSPGRLLRQVDVIAQASGYDRRRLLQWILAYTALSAAWILDDGDPAPLELAVLEIVLAELGSLSRID